MRVLVIGSGGREHAVACKFSRSHRLTGLYCLPGNPGTAEIAENVTDIDPNEPGPVVEKARELGIDLVFVGPEAPLAAGVSDQLAQSGFSVVGPSASAARLETSKAFANEFMQRNGLPCPKSHVFTDPDDLRTHITSRTDRFVVKRSGLAGGKGVSDADDPEALLRFALEQIEHDQVVIEDYLSGNELSVFVAMDGRSYAILTECADYKKAGADGTGPNTGGMGSICPVPWLTPEQRRLVAESIVDPTIAALRNEGFAYRGFLYFGLMMTSEGPYVLEYNVRLGDPEAQVMIPLLDSDLVDLCDSILNDRLKDYHVQFSSDVAVGVVLASRNYPGPPDSDKPVELPPEHERPAKTHLFHAGTAIGDDGTLVTAGGRCFTAVGRGVDLLEARSRAYELAAQVRFDGGWYRPDIGAAIFGT